MVQRPRQFREGDPFDLGSHHQRREEQHLECSTSEDHCQTQGRMQVGVREASGAIWLGEDSCSSG